MICAFNFLLFLASFFSGSSAFTFTKLHNICSILTSVCLKHESHVHSLSRFTREYLLLLFIIFIRSVSNFSFTHNFALPHEFCAHTQRRRKMYFNARRRMFFFFFRFSLHSVSGEENSCRCICVALNHFLFGN